VQDGVVGCELWRTEALNNRGLVGVNDSLGVSHGEYKVRKWKFYGTDDLVIHKINLRVRK
jgi:hypothetical protein